MNLSSPLIEGLISQSSLSHLKQQHDSSRPYTHVILHPLCEANRMIEIHDEAKNNMKATFKETDLFKVFQTGDLATMGFDDPDVIKYKNLLALRDAIYSKSFRDFIASVMNCDDLTERVDCSANAYTQVIFSSHNISCNN